MCADKRVIKRHKFGQWSSLCGLILTLLDGVNQCCQLCKNGKKVNKTLPNLIIWVEISIILDHMKVWQIFYKVGNLGGEAAEQKRNTQFIPIHA